MNIIKFVLVTTVIAGGLFAAGSQVIESYPINKLNLEHNRAVAGDKLFIPEGYEKQLSKNNLTLAAALPYFTSPFVCIAENSRGQQFAAVFQSAEDFKTVRLPLTYEQIANRLKAKGYTIRNIGNLNLFEINDRLVWAFSEAETTVYMELDGKVTTNPFHHK